MKKPYTILFSKNAEKKFDDLMRQSPKVGKQLTRAIDKIAANPLLGVFLQGNWKRYRKYLTGNYRIIHRVEHVKLIVLVVTLGDRKMSINLKTSIDPAPLECTDNLLLF